jgi:hypothetical protein
MDSRVEAILDEQQPAVTDSRPEGKAQIVGDIVGTPRQVPMGRLDFLFPGGQCSSRMGLAPRGDVPGDGVRADRVPVLVLNRRHRHRNGGSGAVLTLPNALRSA